MSATSAFYLRENDRSGRALTSHCNGGQMHVVMCGNDRGINDYWSLYNQLWDKAKYYFTRFEHQLIFVQQASRWDLMAVDYSTWHWFWKTQVEPRAPSSRYQWLIDRDMPFIRDPREPPGKNRFSQPFIDYVRCRNLPLLPMHHGSENTTIAATLPCNRQVSKCKRF